MFLPYMARIKPYMVLKKIIYVYIYTELYLISKHSVYQSKVKLKILKFIF